MSHLAPIIITFTFDSETYSSENSEILQFLHPQFNNRILFVCLFLAQQPPVGQGPLIHEVSRPHTTTHHSR